MAKLVSVNRSTARRSPAADGRRALRDDTKLNAPAARMYVLRSPHAHADIKKIDTSAAAKAPGVLLVLTGQDVKKADFGDVPCLVPLENRDGSPRGETRSRCWSSTACAMSAIRWRWWWPRRSSRPRMRPS